MGPAVPCSLVHLRKPADLEAIKDIVQDLTHFHARHSSILPGLQTVTACPQNEWRHGDHDRE
jgi:hypothetical protein